MNTYRSKNVEIKCLKLICMFNFDENHDFNKKHKMCILLTNREASHGKCRIGGLRWKSQGMFYRRGGDDTYLSFFVPLLEVRSMELKHLFTRLRPPRRQEWKLGWNTGSQHPKRLDENPS